MTLRAALFAAVLTSAACVVLQDGARYTDPPPDTYSAARLPVATGAGESALVDCAHVSSQFFSAAGVKPLIGRLFIEREHQGTATPVAIVSYRWWQDRFGGVPDVIGRTIEIDDRRTTIVGVGPRGFDVPRGVALWLPRPARQALVNRQAASR